MSKYTIGYGWRCFDRLETWPEVIARVKELSAEGQGYSVWGDSAEPSDCNGDGGSNGLTDEEQEELEALE